MAPLARPRRGEPVMETPAQQIAASEPGLHGSEYSLAKPRRRANEAHMDSKRPDLTRAQSRSSLQATSNS